MTLFVKEPTQHASVTRGDARSEVPAGIRCITLVCSFVLVVAFVSQAYQRSPDKRVNVPSEVFEWRLLIDDIAIQQR